MTYEMPSARRPGIQHARIDTEQHVDGRWMWAIEYSHDDGGCGYKPFAKWGKFAASEGAALERAVAEMRDDLRNTRNDGASQIRAWLRTLEQPSLFERSEHV